MVWISLQSIQRSILFWKFGGPDLNCFNETIQQINLTVIPCQIMSEDSEGLYSLIRVHIIDKWNHMTQKISWTAIPHWTSHSRWRQPTLLWTVIPWHTCLFTTVNTQIPGILLSLLLLFTPEIRDAGKLWQLIFQRLLSFTFLNMCLFVHCMCVWIPVIWQTFSWQTSKILWKIPNYALGKVSPSFLFRKTSAP